MTETFVSNGQLPDSGTIMQWLTDAHERFGGNRDGAPSTVYPALAAVAPDLFGLCVVGARGQVFAVGDTEVPFTIMSVSKPFVFALVCQALGPDAALAQIGADATGHPFNALEPIEQSANGRTNPMVNSGAIVTTGLVPGATQAEQRARILSGLSAFAGRDLTLNEAVYASATATNFRNRGLANVLHSLGAIAQDPMEVVDLYTWQCALDVTARDLAVMGATLADGGVNPLTGQVVVDPAICHQVLAMMTTAGMYETSGTWLANVGLPAKSGIGGGLVTVSPGKGGMGVFSPRLDTAGNSVKGQLATAWLSRHLGLGLFTSRPQPRS